MLHLLGPEDDLALSYDHQCAIPQIGDPEFLIVQDGQQAGRRAEHTLIRFNQIDELGDGIPRAPRYSPRSWRDPPYAHKPAA